MKQIISDLYLKDRAVVSDDYDYCLEYLKKKLDFTIREYPSGATYWNWIIPNKYTVKEAYIKDVQTGEVLVDVKNHPLHLASYSVPFEGTLNYEKLKQHLFWNEEVPDGIPNYYKFQYRPWEKNWKFCVSFNQLKRFNKDGKYYVKVNTLFEKGTLKVGEYFKKGKSNDTILLVSHLDHPGQVNDGLSGVVAELALMQQIAKRDTYYSYLYLIVQEFLGSVAYLSQCGNIKNFKMGIFTEMLSTGLPLQLQKSFLGDTYIDKVADMVFREKFVHFDTLRYLEGAGNDEVVFESPGVEIPFVSIMRARSGGKLYRQYHTHLDNLDIVNEQELEEGLNLLARVVDVLEKDFYVERKFNGFTCLSNPNVDLYFNAKEFRCGKKEIAEEIQKRMHSFLFGGFRYFDGKHRISEIAVKYKIPFELMYDFIKKMERKELVVLTHNRQTDLVKSDMKGENI